MSTTATKKQKNQKAKYQSSNRSCDSSTTNVDTSTTTNLIVNCKWLKIHYNHCNTENHLLHITIIIIMLLNYLSFTILLLLWPLLLPTFRLYQISNLFKTSLLLLLVLILSLLLTDQYWFICCWHFFSFFLLLFSHLTLKPNSRKLFHKNEWMKNDFNRKKIFCYNYFECLDSIICRKFYLIKTHTHTKT